MAKANFPLLSLSAHGSFAKKLTYFRKSQKNLVRSFYKPSKIPTPAQYTQRHLYALLVAYWQCMAEDELAYWKGKASLSGLDISAFNFWMKTALEFPAYYTRMYLYLPFNEISGDICYDYSGNKIKGQFYYYQESDYPKRSYGLQRNYGNSLLFNFEGGILVIGEATVLNINTQITIEAWVYPLDLENIHVIFHRGVDEYNRYTFGVWGEKIFFRTYYYPDWSYFVFPTKCITLGWQHIAVTFDAAFASMASYRNGDRIDFRNNEMGFYETFGNSYVGSMGFYPAWGNCNAYIDELRIYKRILSEAEIKKHYNMLRLNKKRQLLF